MQEETGSVNGWGGISEQGLPTFCEYNCQESQLRRVAGKQCLGSTCLSVAERSDKFKLQKLESGQGAAEEYNMGIRMKEEITTENVKENVKDKDVHVSSKRRFDGLEIPRSNGDGKHPPDVIVIEDDNEEDEHTQTLESDACSTKNPRGISEQGLQTFCEHNCQESQIRRVAGKQCLGSTCLSVAERSDKFKLQKLQSGQRAAEEYNMGIRMKEENTTENVKDKDVHVSSKRRFDGLEIPRSNSDGKHPADVIVIEDDSDDDDNEEDENNQILESDASSTKNPRSISCQLVGQRINCNRHPTRNSRNNSADQLDNGMLKSGKYMPLHNMKEVQRQASSMQNFDGYSRYVGETQRSPDSDSSDCEIMEGSDGEIREQWEKAAIRKHIFSGMKSKGPLFEEEVSASGSNLDPNSSDRGFEQEGRNEQQDSNFQGHHVDKSSTDLPDLVSACGIVHTSAQDDVTSHNINKGLVTQKSSIEISYGASLGHSTNTAEVQRSREENRQPHFTFQPETNKILNSSSVEAKSRFATKENSSEWIADREKLKETVAFKHAEQEEWTRRHLELKRQAEEAQRQKMRRKAEACRKLEMERRQKQRLEEIRETQRKDEEVMDLKERLRGQIRARLEYVASVSKDMASLLRSLGIQVEGGAFPSSQQVNAAYKQALLRFHPDRASNHDLNYQVEAEEAFKLIARLKDTLLPVAPTYLKRRP